MAQTSTDPIYSTIYAFGDSLSDAGNLSLATTKLGATEPVSPPYYQELYGTTPGNVFSNGPTWVQDLSLDFGLGTLAPSLLSGTDFAYGGAETGQTPQNQTAADADLQAISLPAQLGQFQAAVPTPTADALYTVSIGSNDVLDILANTSLSAQQQLTDVDDAVANEIGFVKQLISAGATNIAVLDVPDLGQTPEITQNNSAALDAEASQLASAYDSALTTQLAVIASGGPATISLVDAYQLIDAAVADPAAYGLTNVTTPVWSGSYTSASSGTLAATTTAAQDQYLFWDKLHPTETGQQAVTSLAEAQLGAVSGLAVQDTTTATPLAAAALPYIGPVAGLAEQYVSISPDNLNVSVSTPNWFIHTGSGNDAIAASSGTNVLDGGTGSNFLTGGTGTDTFFVDDRAPTAPIWSTMDNFHVGDAATVFGVTPADFTLTWAANEGASGFTGLTLHASDAAGPTASLTLTGYSLADLTDGRLTVSYGTFGGADYMYIHGTG